MGKRTPLWNLTGMGVGLGLVAWAHVHAGGDVAMFFQGAALVVVLGGTTAALVVSYPISSLWQTLRAVARALAGPPESPEPLVPVFAEWASRVRRKGIMSVDLDLISPGDPFLARALSLTTSGVDAAVIRQTLEIDHRVATERDEDQAEVLESAGGYAPTLGIVAAVLGLMRAMEQMSTPDQMGAGIAAAFVATIYGLGMANLVFLPLATRLRTYARLHALRREFAIEGVLALHAGMHPRIVEDRLNGYMAASGPAAGPEAA